MAKIKQASTSDSDIISDRGLAVALSVLLMLPASCSSTGSRRANSIAEDRIISETSIPVAGDISILCKKILGYTYPEADIMCKHTPSSRIWILATKGYHGLIRTQFEISNRIILQGGVLASREQKSRQIKSQRFIRQFSGLSLSRDGTAVHDTDAITGATVSSMAVISAAHLALTLDDATDVPVPPASP